MPDPKRLVVALEPDLFFSVRITEVVQATGGQALILEDGHALWDAIGRWPELILIDLTAPGWEEPVRRAKQLPHTKSIPIIAFGSHVDTEALQAARRAGCDHAWARSRLMNELPALIERALNPPTLWVEGWDEPPPPLLLHGIEQFNAGEYWECHETLETLWREEPRPVRDLYQGILQVGVAFHHLLHDNYPGAIKMFRRGLPRLRTLPDVCQGVEVMQFREAARRVYNVMSEAGPDALTQWDSAMLPKITLVESPQAPGVHP
jgi:predicted metal-dependent hydrolase